MMMTGMKKNIYKKMLSLRSNGNGSGGSGAGASADDMPIEPMGVDEKISETSSMKLELMLTSLKAKGRLFNWKTRYSSGGLFAKNVQELCSIHVAKLTANNEDVIVKLKQVDKKLNARDQHAMLQWNVRELFMLETVRGHPSIIQLTYGIVTPLDETVLELEPCEHTLWDLAQMHRRTGGNNNNNNGASSSNNLVGTIPMPLVQRYMEQLLSGLEHCHKMRILHGDIKATNLFIRNGWLKIADFGAAQQLAPGSNLYSSKPSFQVNSFAYRPMEIVALCKYSPAVDIWAAACTIISLFDPARDPFYSTTIQQLVNIIDMVAGPIPEYYYTHGGNPTLPRSTNDYGDNNNNNNGSGGGGGGVSCRPPFSLVFSHVPAILHDLLQAMLKIDQADRPLAGVLLWHPFFHSRLVG
jgi:serine/threonine protein kinase